MSTPEKNNSAKNNSNNTQSTKDVATNNTSVETTVAPGGEVETRRVNKNLETEFGTTTIDDTVVSKIAGIAAREVSGVAALGGGGARMIGTIRETLGADEDVRQGVSVEVTEGVASVSVAIIAEYGVAIHQLAEAIRRNIITAVERMTGLEVSSVDVTVHDVRLPREDDEQDEQNNTAIASS
ncbi:Asp23/Gls24 family envelope stress response protein [Corynebacterium lizhenjunii]|uniref:Asp23/Gls24 family envelope stress response protein n=1 Tax=Corynebacterium lizhenjunii TaxID=2709394 RepID=A0A7T0PCB3_9CORY|nr:Asp23/Gls24 family envelope stress response protein [Corynebacterium lizhenjunii]QPK79547.1 Asp23/Gls24 family envelope stress response protein [Corynebacterium lizhenjunii]